LSSPTLGPSSGPMLIAPGILAGHSDVVATS
jgi:hypothetical protein